MQRALVKQKRGCTKLILSGTWFTNSPTTSMRACTVICPLCRAFTRTSVGYVHLCPSIGTLHGIGHGLRRLAVSASAHAYGQRIDAQLTALAQQTSAANSDAQDMRAAIATLLHDTLSPVPLRNCAKKTSPQ